MSKYLRHIVVWPEPEVSAVLSSNTVHLPWMYEYYATPYLSGGVSKINVAFSQAASTVSTPVEILNIVQVTVPFDARSYSALAGEVQQRYFLDRLHDGIVRCAEEFGWENQHFDQARERMLADGLKFSFLWKKPLASPDRRRTVQGYVQAGPRTLVSLVFRERTGSEAHQVVLADMSTGSFDLRYIFGKVAWLDNATVQITMDNGRDYWLCHADGSVSFHFPRAERGDAHGQFALGRMYTEGGLLPVDSERGLKLIQSAAGKGDRHALNFLRRMEERGGVKE